MSKKQILIISEYFYPEEFSVNDLAGNFNKKDYEVSVLTKNPSYPFDFIYPNFKNKWFSIENHDGIRIYRIKTLLGVNKNIFRKVLSYLFFALVSSFFLITKLKQQKIIFVYQVGPLTQIIPALISKLLFKSKINLWILDLWPHTVFSYGFKKNFLNKLILNTFCRISYKFSDNIFVSSKGFINEIQKYGAERNNIIYCPQWIPKSLRFKKNTVSMFKKINNNLNFTFAGNIGSVQNLEYILSAFSKYQNSVNLNIIGDGSNLQNLKNISKKLNISNCYFWGRKPIEEISKWLISSDILIISIKDSDNFNLTVPAKFQAYLGANKPLFGVIAGETANLIKEFNLGLVANPSDINDIEIKINQFIKLYNKNKLSVFSSNNKKIIDENYSFKNIFEKFESRIFKS